MKVNNLIGKVGAFAAGAVLAANLSAAPSIEVTNVQQQYPWTNTVDIAYTVSGITNRAYYAVFEAWHGGERIGAVTNELDGTGKSLGTVTTLATQWQPPFNMQKSGVTLTPYIYRGGVDAGGDDYLVIDLETGNVAYEGMINQDFANKRYNTDEFKTRKMAFRKVPKGEYTIGGSYLTRTNYGRYCQAHKVKFPADYYIAVFRVTQAQYAYMTGGTDATAKANKKAQGLVWNTFRGSAGVAAAVTTGPLYDLQTKTGLKIDLPTLAMHSVAMSDGQPHDIVGGYDTYNIAVTNYIWCSNTPGRNGTPDVGMLHPTRWGFYDPAGLSSMFHRDACVASSSGGDTTTTCIMGMHTSFANNFMPITAYSSQRYIMNTGTGHAYNTRYASCLSNTWVLAPSSSATMRLAVYPAAYYPNGGQ